MLVKKILSTEICLITKSERSETKIKNCSKGAVHFVVGIGFTHARFSRQMHVCSKQKITSSFISFSATGKAKIFHTNKRRYLIGIG